MSDYPEGPPDDGPWFEPVRGAASAGQVGDPTNICRVVAMVPLFTGGADDLSQEFYDMGFGEITGRNYYLRPEDVVQAIGLALIEPVGRIELWRRFVRRNTPADALAFVLSILASRDERESAAAAAALDGLMRHVGIASQEEPLGQDVPMEIIDGDDPRREATEWAHGRGWGFQFNMFVGRLRRASVSQAIVFLQRITRRRLEQALRSPDHVTRGFALAVAIEQSQDEPEEPSELPGATPAGIVSALLHGTWGWTSRWWRPNGDFHTYVDTGLPHLGLYTGGARPHWTGALRVGHRRLAARDLADWAADLAPGGLHAVFAHSYGGEIAARAVCRGLRIDRLVLLSVPVNAHIEAAARRTTGIVDVRLRFDPVLALIPGTRQRIPGISFLAPRWWCLDHGATHRVNVWTHHRFAHRASL